jgi:hypothetical protein
MGILNFIKNKIVLIIIVLLVLTTIASLGVAVYFAKNHTTYTTQNYHQEQFQDQRQFQSQGQVTVALYALRGYLDWEIEIIDLENRDTITAYIEAINFVKELPLEIQLFCEIDVCQAYPAKIGKEQVDKKIIIIRYPVFDENFKEIRSEIADYQKSTKK